MADIGNLPEVFYAVFLTPNYKKELLFSGYVKSLSSFTNEGAFDVLPLHENFVTIVRDKVVVVDKVGNRLEFVLGRALLAVTDNVVKVFVEF